MIVQGLNALVQFVTKFSELLYLFGKWVLDGALFVLKAGFYFVLDGFLTIIEGLFATINFGALTVSTVGVWSGLPPQLLYCVNQIGIGAGLTIIVTAIGIRMLLNLIPAAFTRI